MIKDLSRKIAKAIREPQKIRPFLSASAKQWLGQEGAVTEEINLEFVNYCNLRCQWCSLDHKLEKSEMAEKLLRLLFKTLASDKRFCNVTRLYLWNGGETLLHPRSLNMLKVIKAYKDLSLRDGRAFPTIHLLTNGSVLNKDLARSLVNLEVLDTLRFSVDGGSREKFEAIRQGASWEVLSKNIRDFIDISHGKIKTGIICIIEYGKEMNTDWMSDEFKALLKLVDNVELRYPHDWIGNVQVDGLPAKTFQTSCKFLNKSLVILPNGDVTVCCNDLNGESVIGNLYKKSLYNIYHSARRRQIINSLRTRPQGKSFLCKNCVGYVGKLIPDAII